MYVCMCLCVCVYVSMHICVCAFVYMYIHIYKCRARECVYVCMYVCHIAKYQGRWLHELKCLFSCMRHGSFTFVTWLLSMFSYRSLDWDMCRSYTYGVATISRLLKIIVLFYRISSLLWGSFAKETYHSKEPTNRSHPISLPTYVLYIWGGYDS